MGRMGQTGSPSWLRTLYSLFASGEQGAWYDPSDLPTLFQDTAGTTPVTAVEQAVALMLDKSGRGNHASQATSTKRPKYSRRVNLLTKTEQFSDAAWITFSASVTPNAAIAPDGSLTAAKIVPTASSGQHILSQSFTGTAGGVAITAVAKAAEAPIICIRLYDAGAGTGFATYFNVLSGTIGTNAAGNTATITSAGNGYYTCTVSRIALGGVASQCQVMPCLTDGTYAYAGDGSSGIFLWRVSITLATDAHLPYQSVNTATDYDADPAKFPGYLRFDGVDDALSTGNIDFTGTDKMTMWAGITKLSDAAVAIFAELSSNASTNAGAFYISAPETTGASGDLKFKSRGTLNALPAPSGAVPAPVQAVVCGIGGIATDTSIVRINGIQVGSTSSDQGIGNYGNYPLYIGGRGGTSLFFNGRLYSLIVRGAQSSLSQIEATELYIKRKMRLP